MTKKEFKTFIENGPIFLDGATGSNLQKLGMPFGVCAEKWITENKDVLIKLQRQYIDAGSQIIYAPTFGANSIKLKEYGLEDKAVSLNKTLIEISKEAATDKALVAGDITMCGQTLEPLGDLYLEHLISSYEQQISAVDEAGADLIVIETMMSLQETRAALIAASNVSSLPVMVTMTFGDGGKTLYGTDAKTAAIVLSSLGADAVGMNCSAGPDKMLELVSQMCEVTNLPIIAKPNAGMPSLGESGNTIYDMNADEFAAHMKNIAKAGAVLFGGCCGTTPEYIRKVKDVLSKDFDKTEKNTDIGRYIAAEREYIDLSKIEFCKIDTRENAEIKDEIDEDEFDTIYDLLDDMEDNGQNAVLLCVDGNENPISAVKALLGEISGYTSCPLCFVSDNEDVLNYALKHYCGIAAVVINDKNRNFAEKIGKKYGACIV